MPERLVNSISICQHLGQDASGEAFKPDAVKAHLQPRQPTGKSVATMSSLETSSAPCNEHLLLKASKPLSPALLNSSPIQSQTSEWTSWPPETLTTGRRHSPPQQWAPSYPSQPLDPMAYPPPMPDLGMAVTSQSSQTLPGLPSPMPGTPGINLSRRPTLTTPGLNYSSRSTSTSLGLNHLSRPTSTTPGLNHLSRPTSTIEGLNHLSRPTSTIPGLDHLSRPTSTTEGLNHLSRPTSTTSGLDRVSRPTSTTSGLEHSRRPTSTTEGLNHLSRPTSTIPGLEHLSRPTSTTAGLNHLSRPTSTTEGLNHLSRPTSTTAGLNHLSRPTSTTPGLNHLSRPTSTTEGLNHLSRPTSTTAGLDVLSRPTSTTPGLNHLSRPTSTTEGLNHLSRPTSTTAGLDVLSRPTSTTPGLNHLSRPTSTTAGFDFLSSPTSTITGLDHLSRSTSTTSGLDRLSRPTSTTSGLDRLSRPTSTTSGLDHLRRPTSTTSGLEHSRRPTSGPFRDQVTSRTLCSSTSSPGESLQKDLSLTIHKASFWTGPTDSQIEPGEPSFISPVIQEILEVQIRRRVQLKLYQEKGKGRSDLSYGCMGSMLHVCSSKEANITSHLFSSKDNNSKQLSGHQKVIANDLKDKYIQLYWGLPWLHSESLMAPVLMAGSSLDPPSILFNGLSTYSPLHGNTKGLPQLCSPQPLFHHLVKSDSLIPKVSCSQTPSETRIQAKAHDPSSLSKLSCSSTPIRKDGASCPTPTRTEVIVSPSVRQLECHLVKKHRESRSNLPVMVKNSQEAVNQQTSNSWGSQGQGPVVHLQGDYISPKLREQTEEDFKMKLTQHQGPWPPKVQLSLGLGQAEVNPKRKQTSDSEVPGGICYDTCIDHAFVPSEFPKLNPETWNKPSFHESVTNKNNTNGPSFVDLGTQKLLKAHIKRHLVRHRWRLPLRGLKAIHILKMKKDTTLPFPRSSNDSLSCDSTDNSMIQLASNLREPIQHAPEREAKTKTFSVESQFTQNCRALQPALMREALPRNDSGPSEAPTTTLGYSENLLSTPESLVGRAWHKDTLFRSWEEFPEPNRGRIQESEGGTLIHYNEVSVREISAASQSSRNRATRELEETEEEESCEWTIPVEAAKMADFQFLEARGNLSKTLPQNADGSGLRRAHCSTAAVILQDCATGELCQHWDPEVVIAAEILASRAAQGKLKTEPATIKPTVHYRSPFLGRDNNVLKNHKLEEPQHTNKYGTNIHNEKHRSPPRHNIQLKGTKPDRAYIPDNVTFGDKMKRVLLTVLNPTHKVTNHSIENCKGVPSMTPSQGNQKHLSTVCHAKLKIQSQPSPDGGMPYGNRQARASRDPVYLDSSYQDRAHVAHVPGIPVYCPRHGHCIKV
ncbi:spermatogenesis-associated protein 31A5-like [Microtus pennsylvanicus]|uniref:spermatogenesis-associated protein 31A5-like n=1 Tax=Microtus pennsylvanicus TaxID=10058 RepID=UPI003F6CA91E